MVDLPQAEFDARVARLGEGIVGAGNAGPAQRGSQLAHGGVDGRDPRSGRGDADIKPRFDATMAGLKDARGARRVVPDAPLPRPVDAYAGEYEHPAYGRFSITADGDALRPRLGTMDLSLAHRHYETFDLEWHELGDESHLFPLMFLSDPDGHITALTVPLEPSVEPLRFDRLPDAISRDPALLRRLCGTFAMGPMEIVVTLQGEDTLAVTVPGAPPLQLLPGRGLRFEVQGQPGVTAEFELDDSGSAARIVAQPLGILHRKD
jgi:hypothetical protein